MADPFSMMITNLSNMGFFQLFFPFLLAFAIMYGVLQTVFDKKLGGNRVHAVISIVIAFFVMFYSGYNVWLHDFLSTASGTWLGIATVLLFLVVLASLAGVDLHDLLGGEGAPKWLKYVALLVILYIVIVIFIGAGNLTPYLPYWLTGSDLWTVILVVIILAVVFWFFGSGEEKAAAPEGEKK